MTPRKKAPTVITKSAAPQRHWSYSSYSVFAQCSLKYKYQYVEKLPTTTSYAMARGTDIHAKAENLVKGIITGMPPELAKFSKEFKALQKHKPRVEEWIRLDTSWRVVPEGSKQRPWLFGKADVYAVLPEQELLVIDHKTGKQRPSHIDQAELYATAVKAVVDSETPDTPVMSVHAEFWYLDHGTTLQQDYTGYKLESLRGTWHDRGMQVTTATKFKAQPGYACRWCDFRSDKGGPCKEWINGG